MIVKLKIKEVIEANIACKNLLKKSFPAKTAFKIVCLTKKLTEIEQSFEEIKNNTINKYAQRDESGKIITETLKDGQIYIPISTEFQKKCSEELTEALNQELEIFSPVIKIEELEGELIVVEELMGMYPFIMLNEEDSE